MITFVPVPTLASDDLTALLERFRSDRVGARPAAEVSEAQLQLLLARMAALTDTLREAEPSETARLASRLLMNDLAAVADQFRGRANTMRAALAKALKDLRSLRSTAPGAE